MPLLSLGVEFTETEFYMKYVCVKAVTIKRETESRSLPNFTELFPNENHIILYL